MNSGYRYFSAVLAIFCAGSASSAPSASNVYSELDFLTELPVVLSVSRLAQPLRDTPAAVTVIDREMIRQSGARDVAELFRLVPGFSVGLAPQAPHTVVYHGLTETEPRRMQVLVDGRSQYSAFYYGGVNWNLLPVALDDIERIEVVRGSNSAAYGANAFLGVANIITRSAAGMPKVSLHKLDGQGEARDRMARVAYSDETFQLRVTSLDSGDQGIDFLRDTRRRRLLDIRSDWRATAADEISIRLGRVELDFEQGFPDSFGNPARDQRKATDFAQIDWKRTLSDGSDIALRYFRTDERSVERAFFRLTPAVFVDADYGFKAIRDDVEFAHTLRPADEWRVVWGGNWRRDVVHAPHFLNQRPKISEHLFRAFGNVEWLPNEHWTLNFGVNHERGSLDSPNTAPRLAANFHITPELTVRAGISRAYRNPGVFEKRGNQAFVTNTGVAFERGKIDNQSLHAESMLSREIGVLANSRALRLAYDARAFDERIGRRMQAYPELALPPDCERPAPLPAPYCAVADRVENAENARIRGFEHRVDYQPWPGTRLVLSQAFMSIRARAELPNGTVTPVFPAAGFDAAIEKNLVETNHSAPTHSTSLFFSQALPWDVEVSAVYSSVGSTQFTNDSNLRNPAYQRLDWRLAKRFQVGPTRGEIAFSVQGDGEVRSEYKQDLPLTKRGFLSLRLEY